jgi:hypothetical protein
MKNVARHTVVLFAFILLCAEGTANAAVVDMKEGEWEISSETSMTMGAMSMPPMANKSTYCLTREDLVPKTEKDKDCKMVKQKVVGNTVSWRIECKKSEGEGEITYRGSTYKGNFRMKMVEDGQTMTMNTKLAGKYLAPCPKGQKSGPTGETAKQVAKGQEMAALGKQQQAEQEALRKKCEEFVKRTAVPAEVPGACEQEGFTRSQICEEKVGKLNLEYGQYEITVEEASRISSSCALTETKRKILCLNTDDPVPQELRKGRQVRKTKHSKDKITWRESYEGGETLGGVVYRGTSFEGVVIQKSRTGSDTELLQVTKVTGRRVGVGDCPKERGPADMGRGYSAQPREGATSTDVLKGIGENPVKGLRKLFGR